MTFYIHVLYHDIIVPAHLCGNLIAHNYVTSTHSGVAVQTIIINVCVENHKDVKYEMYHAVSLYLHCRDGEAFSVM